MTQLIQNIKMREHLILKSTQLNEIELFKTKLLKSPEKKYIVSIVLVGSVARGEHDPDSDIDLLILVDDTIKEYPGQERIKEKINEICDKISQKLSIQLFALSDFWSSIITDFQIIYCFIKDGRVIYDSMNIFVPLKRLVVDGKFQQTREARLASIIECKNAVERFRTIKLLMIAEDTYKAFLRAAEAVIMQSNRTPPNPSIIHEDLDQLFTDILIENPKMDKILRKEFPQWLKEIVDLRKKIERKEITS